MATDGPQGWWRLRQRHVALDLRPVEWTPRVLRQLSGRLGEEYAGKGPKTITRDLNELEKMHLLTESRTGI